MTKIATPKICESCGKTFSRKIPQVTLYKFSKMRYCSNQCRAKGNGYNRRGIPMGEDKKRHLATLAKKRLSTEEDKASFVSRMAMAREAKRINNPDLTYGGRKEDKIRARSTQRPNTTIYRVWRQAVLLLGNDKCSSCGSSKELHVDHIKPYVLFEELRFAIDNGRVLCKYCHMKTDTFGFNIRKHRTS